jgi:hypothetical protein
MEAIFEKCDVRPILPSVRLPTLVLHRRDDPIPVDHGRYYAEHIPDARLVELEGSDHSPYVGDYSSSGTRPPITLLLHCANSSSPRRDQKVFAITRTRRRYTRA